MRFRRTISGLTTALALATSGVARADDATRVAPPSGSPSATSAAPNQCQAGTVAGPQVDLAALKAQIAARSAPAKAEAGFQPLSTHGANYRTSTSAADPASLGFEAQQ